VRGTAEQTLGPLTGLKGTQGAAPERCDRPVAAGQRVLRVLRAAQEGNSTDNIRDSHQLCNA